MEILAKDPAGLKVMTDIVCRTEEISNVCRRSENSVLRKKEYEVLSDLSWKKIYVEIESKCPATMQFLITLLMERMLMKKNATSLSDVLCFNVPQSARIVKVAKIKYNSA